MQKNEVAKILVAERASKLQADARPAPSATKEGGGDNPRASNAKVLRALM
jgi:hypothetical protein